MNRVALSTFLLLLPSIASANIAIYRQGWLVIDSNDSHLYEWSDEVYNFGMIYDRPFVENDTNGCKIGFGVVRGATYLFTRNNYVWDAGDFQFNMGTNPLPISFDGVPWAFENGDWINGDAVYARFGQTGDFPVAGLFFGATGPRRGIYRPGGDWVIDSNSSGVYERSDVQFRFGGLPQDLPIVGDFNQQVPGQEIGVFRDGQWLIDFNGNHNWDGPGGGDQIWSFGQAGDVPLWINDCTNAARRGPQL